MDALMRLWGAVAALGAALIALAVGAAAVPWVAVPMVAAGVAQAVVAVVALRGSRLPAPVATVPLLAPTLLWLAALAVPGSAGSLPIGPMLAESALALASAALLAVRRRPSTAPRPVPALLALVSAAAVVATVATAALAGTHAGAFAQPHGDHGSAGDGPSTDAPAREAPVLQEHDGH